MTPSVGWMNGLGSDFLMMMIWLNGRGGLGLSWRWRMICLCTIMGAGRLWGMGSMPSGCLMRTRGDLQLSGGMVFRRGGGLRLRAWRNGEGVGPVRRERRPRRFALGMGGVGAGGHGAAGGGR